MLKAEAAGAAAYIASPTTAGAVHDSTAERETVHTSLPV